MKHALLVLFFSFNAWATTPVDVGSFEGVLMTGAVIHHPVTIHGGRLSSCVQSRENRQELHTCSLDGAKVSVTDGGANEYHFKKVVVLQAGHETVHYYFSGERRLQVGTQDVVQAVSMTINVVLKDKSKVTGYLDLRDSGVRSAFEAFRK